MNNKTLAKEDLLVELMLLPTLRTDTRRLTMVKEHHSVLLNQIVQDSGVQVLKHSLLNTVNKMSKTSRELEHQPSKRSVPKEINHQEQVKPVALVQL
jgi:hypothetical protein